MIPLLNYAMFDRFLFRKVQCALNKSKLKHTKKEQKNLPAERKNCGSLIESSTTLAKRAQTSIHREGKIYQWSGLRASMGDHISMPYDAVEGVLSRAFIGSN